MGFLLLEVPLLVAIVIATGYYCFLLPPKYPENIPAIPFWVALLPFFKDVDQSDIFRTYIDKPLREHGAVKLFFAAQWNVLVHRPAYMAEVFKDEDLFEKSGNQKKIPHSVLAQFLGDNIISAHGSTWKTYQSVVKPGLQRNFDGTIVANNAHKLTRLLRDAQKTAGSKGVPVQDFLQRYSVANCSEGVLQTQFHDTQATILKEILAHGAQAAEQSSLADMPHLTSVIYESLRLFPPIGQLINRRATRDTFLGGDEVLIPEGTYLGYNCYSTNRDPDAWGPDADEFVPARWGKTVDEIQTHYRRRRARGEFISFHGGRRSCLGERFALLQLRITLVVLIQTFKWSLDPTWADRMTPAGPLYPRALRLTFAERSPGDE
ncbi:cytochrome P450 [Ilyonectria robusta]